MNTPFHRFASGTLAILLFSAVLIVPALDAAEVSATLGIDSTRRAGTDGAGRVLLFTPNPLQGGSSVSHWDSSAFPDLLMEPTSGSLGFAQLDLTVPQMEDMGWRRGGSNLVLRVQDPPGQGFNDPTLGGQRLAAMQFVADRWASVLRSSVTINVAVGFEDLPCSAGGGTLAQAGPEFIFESFAGAPVAGTWYPGALAESLSGQNLSLEDVANPNAGDLGLTFNSRIDQACLGSGTRYYYGLNGNVPSNQISFVNVALHETGHALGFASFVNETTGAWFMGLPDIFSRFLFDNDQGRSWAGMNNSQRAASAINPGRVAWLGSKVTAQAPGMLQGAPALIVSAPASIASSYGVGTAQFGPTLTAAGISGNIVIARDGSSQPNLVCGPVVNAGEIAGNIAMIDRGTCLFVEKVKSAQNAGARGVVIVNNVSGSPPNMGGDDATINIPSVSIRIQDGDLIKAALAATDPVDPPGSFRFSAGAYTVGEGDGNATITVTRSGGSTGQVSVDYATGGGTATAGADYAATSGTFTFADGEGGDRTFQVAIVDDAEQEIAETVNLTLANPTGGATLGSPSSAVLTIGDNEPCITDDTTLCLNGGRFRVRIRWRDFQDLTGDGMVVSGGGTDDSGLMWFFDPDNWELLVKVLDGCAITDHFWVFAAATTDVAYTLRVTDTQTGLVQEYENPIGTASPSVTDTAAFAVCP